MPFDVEAARKSGYSDDEILKHLTTSRKFDVDGARKAGYSNQEIIGHLRVAKPTDAPSFGSRMLDTGIGMAKGLGTTLSNVGSLLTRGEEQLYSPGGSKAVSERVGKLLKPTNASQSVGHGTEQFGEYMLPLGEASLVPKALQVWQRVVLRSTLDAARTGVTATAQTGDVRTGLKAGATAGATSGLIGALTKPAAILGRKIQASTIRPRVVDMTDGFKWETLDKFKLKGNLEDSLKQVDARLTELRNARNKLIAPGSANVNLEPAFDDAMREVEQDADKLEFGHMGKDAQAQLKAIRKDVEDLISPAPKAGPQLFGPNGKPIAPPAHVPNLNVDIEKAENLKEFMGTLGSWAYGHGDPDAKVKELIANTMYSKLKVAIENAMGSQGPQVKALNKSMQELIPVKHAMLARLPVEERNRLFSLADIAAMLPAVATGDARLLALEGLTRAQKSLRFGNWLVRAKPAEGAASVAGRAAGAGVRLGKDLPSTQ